jgi:hypothetical protein
MIGRVVAGLIVAYVAFLIVMYLNMPDLRPFMTFVTRRLAEAEPTVRAIREAEMTRRREAAVVPDKCASPAASAKGAVHGRAVTDRCLEPRVDPSKGSASPSTRPTGDGFR